VPVVTVIANYQERKRKMAEFDLVNEKVLLASEEVFCSNCYSAIPVGRYYTVALSRIKETKNSAVPVRLCPNCYPVKPPK